VLKRLLPVLLVLFLGLSGCASRTEKTVVREETPGATEQRAPDEQSASAGQATGETVWTADMRQNYHSQCMAQCLPSEKQSGIQAGYCQKNCDCSLQLTQDRISAERIAKFNPATDTALTEELTQIALECTRRHPPVKAG
jgi:uncharacterized protein YceK